MILLSLVCSGAFAVPVDPALRPRVHDWFVRDVALPEFDIVPTPHPGWDQQADDIVYQTLYASQFAAGEPIGIMLRDGTAPLFGFTDPEALATTISLVPRLDFVFADLEIFAPELAMLEVVNLVRFNPDPAIYNAWIGAYHEYPGIYDESYHSPWLAMREFSSEFYLASGMDVAMPSCYPYGAYQAHTWPDVWGRNIAPNVRSALFWAPIHRTSVAKIDLPASHMLIPWVATYVNTPNYPTVPPPAIADMRALVQHMRLRGADGFYLLNSWLEEYPTPAYRIDLDEAWHALDFFFAATDEAPTVMNQETDKVGGVQWSGMTKEGVTLLLVSNLGNADVALALPGGPWPDDGVVTVIAGSHQWHVSGAKPPDTSIGNCDLTGDGLVDAADLGLQLAAWGSCIGLCFEDLDYNGIVDSADIGWLLASWSE